MTSRPFAIPALRSCVLDEDADLAQTVPESRREEARRASVTGVVTAPPGAWAQPRQRPEAAGGYGLLVLAGLLARRVGREGRYGAELLGVGDLLRPWDSDNTASTHFDISWRVFEPARFAVLDPAWTTRMAAYPQVGAELAGRALTRSRRVVNMMAIAQHPRLEDRLLLLFWELADRFGRVHPDGVHVDLPLTHEVLSHLAAARRPSVSGALSRLAATGALRRAGRGWIISGEPGDVQAELDRLVS
jgi:CRP/FNR family transcriptional regulator, cyclic AMP receptor protein